MERKIMKILLSIVLLLFTLMGCRSYRCEPKKIIGDEEEFWRYRDNPRLVYQNADSTFTWYPITFLKIDSPTFVSDNEGHIYLLTDSIGSSITSLSKLFKRSDVYFVGYGLLVAMILSDLYSNEVDELEALIPPGCVDRWYRDMTKLRSISRDKRLNIVTFPQQQPYGYLLVLMTGKAYNYNTYHFIIDGPIKGPVPFPDENAYYKVLIPLYKKDNN